MNTWKFHKAIAHILALAQESFDYALHVTVESAAVMPVVVSYLRDASSSAPLKCGRVDRPHVPLRIPG
jgi:hypothetical protein